MYAEEPLHPASLQTLRQLIHLHGADRLIRTIRSIDHENRLQQPSLPIDLGQGCSIETEADHEDQQSL